MKAVPLELKDANAYVEKYHRHHKAVSRDKFRVGCEEGEEWYEDIGEMPTVFDISMAIKLLEAAESGHLKVIDDSESTDCAWK